MPVITSNPRYERLAQCLAAGMRQSAIAKELDFSETSVSLLKDNKEIQSRLTELLEDRASKLSASDRIATIDERKRIYSEIARHSTEQPVSAGHRIAAARALDELEGKIGSVTPMVAIQVVLPSAQSTQSLPEPAKTLEIEAKSGDITAIVRTSEAITTVTEAKRLLKGHRWTAEEKAELMREVFGDEEEEVNDDKANSDPA